MLVEVKSCGRDPANYCLASESIVVLGHRGDSPQGQDLNAVLSLKGDEKFHFLSAFRENFRDFPLLPTD